MGTLLLLLGGYLDSGSMVSRSMSARWVVYVGKISYPLYLWHWPVLVLFRSNRLYESSPASDVFAVVISVGLAILTYEIIEKGLWKEFSARPRMFGVPSPVMFTLCGAVVALGIGVGLGGWARYGWAYNGEELRLNAARQDMPPLNCMFQSLPDDAAVKACLGDTRKPTILLWGDSHANHWRPAVTRATEALGYNLATLTMNACRPLPGPVGTPECVAFNAQVAQIIRNWKGEGGMVGVIVSARWPEGMGTPVPSIADAATRRPGEYFDRRARDAKDALHFLDSGLNNLALMLGADGKRLVIIGPSPVQRFAAVHCLSLRPSADCGVGIGELLHYVSAAETAIRSVVMRNQNIRIFDPLSFMCSAETCPALIDGVIVYTDDEHITRTYALAQASRFTSLVAWLGDAPMAKIAGMPTTSKVQDK